MELRGLGLHTLLMSGLLALGACSGGDKSGDDTGGASDGGSGDGGDGGSGACAELGDFVDVSSAPIGDLTGFEGGYEAAGAMVYYNRPNRFDGTQETRIFDAVQALMPKTFVAPAK